MVLFNILAATIVVSLISLIGVLFTEHLKDSLMHKMVSFAAGALLGAAFLELIPEGADHAADGFYYTILVGFLLFFVLEKFIYWYHCHEGACDVHPVGYLSLIGDALHNLLDGIIIAVAFMSSYGLGLTATTAVIFHEIPQELGDYAILRHTGWSRNGALAANFLSACTAIFGAVLTYLFLDDIPHWTPLMVGIAAGGFIYIASADLVPEIHKILDSKESLVHFAFMVLGILAIVFVSVQAHVP